MTRSLRVHLNDKQGQEIELRCPRCSGKTAHEILVAADIHGCEDNHDFSVDWLERNQVVQCKGCKTASFRRTSSNSEDYEHIDETGTISHNVIETLYPPRLDVAPTLSADSFLLPFDVKRIYDETVLALQNQSPVLTAMGLRALIEAVCKQKKAKGRSLLLKIDSLVAMQVLTPIGAGILHKIRALGNESAHEVKPHSEKQLSVALSIVEHVLREVYIIPHLASSEFST
jgi:hypothetical protein